MYVCNICVERMYTYIDLYFTYRYTDRQFIFKSVLDYFYMIFAYC